MIKKDIQLFKFSAYGFLKNLRFFDAFIFLFFLQQGMNYFQIGLLISIREISVTILEIPSGFIADLLGRRRAMVFSFIAYIISFLIFYFFPSFLLYTLAMIFFGMGDAFRTGTHKALIMSYLKLKSISHLKLEYYGFTRSWSKKGSAVAALIAGAVVYFSGNYRYVFLASVIPYILGLILLLTYPKELDEFSKIKAKKSILKEFLNLLKDFGKLFKNRTLRRAVINSSLFDGIFKSVKDYIQPIMKSMALAIPILMGLRGNKEAILIAIIYFFIFILSSAASRNADKYRSRFSSIMNAINSSFLTGLILIAIAGFSLLINFKLVAVLGLLLLFVFQNFRKPMSISYISDNLPEKLMASGLSTESQLRTFFAAIISPVLGFMADRFGIGIAFICLSCLTLILYPLIQVKSNSKFIEVK